MLDFLGNLFKGGMDLYGGILGQKNQQAIAQENIAMQKEFAQNGVQWKVNDAKAAGINPLAALGASTSSFSNVVGDNSLGEGVQKAGQDLSRAITSTATKDDQHTIVMNKLAEQKGELENNLLASQIARLNNAGASGPPTPAAGQRYGRGLHGQTIDATDTGTVFKLEPNKLEQAVPGRPDIRAGENPGTQFVAQGNSLYPVMSDSFAKGTSNDSVANLIYRVKNELGFGDRPPSSPGEGRVWRWFPTQGWKSVPEWAMPDARTIARSVRRHGFDWSN